MGDGWQCKLDNNLPFTRSATSMIHETDTRRLAPTAVTVFKLTGQLGSDELKPTAWRAGQDGSKWSVSYSLYTYHVSNYQSAIAAE